MRILFGNEYKGLLLLLGGFFSLSLFLFQPDHCLINLSYLYIDDSHLSLSRSLFAVGNYNQIYIYWESEKLRQRNE